MSALTCSKIHSEDKKITCSCDRIPFEEFAWKVFLLFADRMKIPLCGRF